MLRRLKITGFTDVEKLEKRLESNEPTPLVKLVGHNQKTELLIGVSGSGGSFLLVQRRRWGSQ